MKRVYYTISLSLLLLAASTSFAQTEPAKPKVSRGSAQKIVAAIELFTKKNDLAGAVSALNEIKAKEANDYYVNSWLGYLFIRDGKFGQAVEPLKTALLVQPNDVDLMTNLALAQDKSGDKAGALQSYKFLAQSKKDSGILNKMGVLCLDMGKVPEAISYFEQADQLTPNDKVITLNLAVAYQKSGDSKKALETYRRLLTMSPDNESKSLALSWLGYAAIQNGDYSTAISHLEAAMAIRGDDLEVMNNLANAYCNAKPAQEDKALSIYQKMVSADSSLYEPWYNMGVIYLKRKDANNAVMANEKALGIRPDEPFALNNLGRGYEMQGRFAMAGDCYARASKAEKANMVFAHNAGSAYAMAKSDELAIQYIEKSISLGDKDNNIVLVLAELYARQGKFEKAMSLYEMAGKSVNDRADMWFNMGVLKQKGGDMAGAEECYRKALDLKPDDLDANQNLAFIFLETKRYSDAIPYFEKVSGANPSSVDAKINLSALYFQTGRSQDAEKLWREILKIDSKRTDIRLNLANVLWNRGDHDAAAEHYILAAKQQPNNAQALNGLGLVQLKNGKNADAENSFRSAVKFDAKYMPSYNNLAVSLERQNKRKDAIVVLTKALELDPNFADARKNLERLKSAEH